MVRPIHLRTLVARRLQATRYPLLRAYAPTALGLGAYGDIAPGSYLPSVGPVPPQARTWSLLPRVGTEWGQWFRLPPTNNVARYAGESKRLAADLPRGAPPIDISVQPVWVSRLVNMQDFLPVLIEELAWPGTTDFVFVVPGGYSAILTEFRYTMDPLPLAALADVTVSLLVDDRIVTNFVNMPFGASMTEYQKTWVMARQGERIILRMTTINGPFAGIDAFVYLYGHLCLSDGRPLGYEVGVKVKPTVVTDKPPAPPLAPPVPPGPAPCPPGALWRDAQGRCVMPQTVRGAR